ncbi:MAG: POTRA domain-containing protein [Hyphomicrobiaceae bacterium]|nr:POTRA domain-containing protein [Hyphomicrobiaceae bacterium]
MGAALRLACTALVGGCGRWSARKQLLGLALALLLPAWSAPANAQRPQGVVVTEEFEAKAAQRNRRSSAPINLPKFADTGSAAATAPLFKLKSVSVVGDRAIPRKEIVNSYANYIGRSVSQKDLGDISAAVTSLYRDKGFALSRAFFPPQDIDNGRIQLKVVEGYVEEASIEALDDDWLIAREMLAEVKEERPTRLRTLERAMLLVADIPGMRIKDASITEIGNGTGRFRLRVKADFQRVGANVEFDNRGSRDVGPWQNFTSAWFNSVATRGDTLVINAATVPSSPRQLMYIGSVYDAPLGSQGLRAGVRVSYSQGWPDGWQGLVDTRTQTQDYLTYVSYAALRSRDVSLRLSTAMGFRNSDEGDNIGPTYSDRVRTISAGADLQFNDRLRGSNSITVTGRHGLSWLSASDSDPNSSRANAPSDFAKVTFIASRYQPIAGPFSLSLSAAGQASSAPLLKSESLFFGGSQFGRAFAPGSIYGDSGVAGLAELRFDQHLGLEVAKAYQLYGFIDRGILWTRGYDFQSLSSAGGGLRLLLNDSLRAGFEIATSIDTGGLFEQETRFYVSLARAFKNCDRAWCN